MPQSANGVITAVGRRKLCRAHAGDAPLPVITHMAWGDGGVDDGGAPKAASGNETGLYNQLMVKAVESHEYPNEEQTTCRYRSTLTENELTGSSISEIGLLDSGGDLIAYRTFLAKGKDADIPQTYEMDEIF